MIPSTVDYEQYVNGKLFSSNLSSIRMVESFDKVEDIKREINHLQHSDIDPKYEDIIKYYNSGNLLSTLKSKDLHT